MGSPAPPHPHLSPPHSTFQTALLPLAHGMHPDLSHPKMTLACTLSAQPQHFSPGAFPNPYGRPGFPVVKALTPTHLCSISGRLYFSNKSCNKLFNERTPAKMQTPKGRVCASLSQLHDQARGLGLAQDRSCIFSA